MIHQYSSYANKTLDWLPCDTKQLYEHNIAKNFEQLQKYGWDKRSFQYKFNSLGFRGEEFTNNPSIMFLGCSFTVGIGLPFEDVWTSIVSNKLNLNQMNLGIGGAANDTAFRLASHYIWKLKPKVVIFLQTSAYRLELLEYPNNFYNLLPEYYHDQFANYYKSWISKDENSQLNQLKNTMAIGHICNTNKIKFLYYGIQKIKNLDYARDLSHYGTESNRHFAESILTMV